MTVLQTPTTRNPLVSRRIDSVKVGYACGVLILLFASNVYDPGGIFRIKYFAFVPAVFLSIWSLSQVDLSVRELIGGLLLFVVWPFYALLNGVVRRGDLTVALAEITPLLFALPLVSILPTLDRRRPLRLYYGCLFSLAGMVLMCFVLIVLFPNSAVSTTISDLLLDIASGQGFFGTKSFGSSSAPLLYLGSTLFLVPTSVYYLFVGKSLRALLTFLAIVLTWSKAGIFIIIAFALVHLILAGEKTGTMKWLRALPPLAALAGILWVVLLSFPGFSEQITDTWAGESESAQVRLGHVTSVTDLFAKHPQYLLWGQGLGVPFYSIGESDYVQSFELDYLNTIRKFGIFWFAAFSAFVLIPAWNLVSQKDKELRAFGFASLSMYLAAGTNPVLLAPLFVVLATLSYFAQRNEARMAAVGPRDFNAQCGCAADSLGEQS